MSGDTFDILQSDRRETLRGTLHDMQATPGDVLTVQADKSIAAKPGGGSMPTSDLLAWFDVSDAATVNAGNPADGDPITTLHDKSGNGNDAAGAGDDLPIYVADLNDVFPIGCTLPAATAGYLTANVSWFDLPLTLFGGLTAISIVGVYQPTANATFAHAEWTGGFNPSLNYTIGSAHDWIAAWGVCQNANGVCFPSDDGFSSEPVALPPAASVCRLGDDGSGTGQTCPILAELFVYGRALHAGEVRYLREYLSAKWTAI